MTTDVRTDFISYKIGDDRPIAWELLEVDGEALAAGQFSARSQVRPYAGGPLLHEWATSGENPRARFTSVPGDTEDAPARWYIELLVDDSRSWTWRRGEFDLYITDPDGRAQPIVPNGIWVNQPAITDG